MKQMFSAGIVVYRKFDGIVKYLLLHNEKGHWDFPKGEIEKGEDKKTAALRELQEEAGITATIKEGFEHSFSYFFTDEDGEKVHKTVCFFTGEMDNADVKLSHEHDDFLWLPLQEALEILSFDEGKELLKQADQFVAGL